MSVNYRYLVSFLAVELYSMQVLSNDFDFYEIVNQEQKRYSPGFLPFFGGF